MTFVETTHTLLGLLGVHAQRVTSLGFREINFIVKSSLTLQVMSCISSELMSSAGETQCGPLLPSFSSLNKVIL